MSFVASADVFAASYDGDIVVNVHLFLVDIDGVNPECFELASGPSPTIRVSLQFMNSLVAVNSKERLQWRDINEVG